MRVRIFRSLLLAFALAVTGLATTVAHAGEVLVGKEALETGDDGAVTKAGRAAAVKELPSEPGEEVWPLHLWAKIDKGAPGPLYVEFFGKLPDGKPYLAYRHEHAAYDGEKFVSLSIELDGNQGFNKGKTYKIELTQANDKGKSIKLASGQVTLAYTEPPPDEDDDDEGDDDGDEDDGQSAEQDALDSFAEGDGGGGGDGPPPVEPKKKKGCSVEPGDYGGPGILILLALGALIRRRRDD